MLLPGALGMLIQSEAKYLMMRHGKKIIGFGVTFLCLFMFAKQLEFNKVLLSLQMFYWPYFFIGFISLSLGYALRIYRWKIMLSGCGGLATFKECSYPFLGSIALNNVLPFRLGDIFRTFVFCKTIGVTKTASASSLIVERLFDLATLLVCFSIGLLSLNAISIPKPLVETVIFLSVSSGIFFAMLLLMSSGIGAFLADNQLFKNSKSKIVHRGIKIVGQLIIDISLIMRPKTVIFTFFLSMMIWLGEAGLYYSILLGFGINEPLNAAVFVMSVATLSTLIPSSPGYIGSFHLAAFTAVTLIGGATALAGSYAVIAHLALWVPTTFVGGVMIMLKPELFQSVKQQLKLMKNKGMAQNEKF